MPHPGDDRVQTGPEPRPRQAAPPGEAVSSAGGPAPEGAGAFRGLTGYPVNPFRLTELPPRKTYVVEVVAGAVLGAAVGGVVGTGAGDGYGALLAVLVGGALGILDGLVVGAVTEPTGTLTAWNVLAAMPRLVLVSLFGLVAPGYFLAWTVRRDQSDG